jgi:hypothetical protein
MAKNNLSLIKVLVCVALIMVIVMRDNVDCNYSHIATLVLLYIIIDEMVDNIVLSFVYAVLVWIILFVILKNYLKKGVGTMENFENDDKREKDLEKATKKRVSYLKNMIKKLEGGVALTKEDMEEKNEIADYDFKKSRVSDDEDEKAKDKNMEDLTPREAQRETFQLINTVKQLKSTVNELAPLLKEGKNILSTLGALKV